MANHDRSLISAKHRVLHIATSLVAISVLAACGSPPEQAAVPDPVVETEKIDAGNYPTTPIDPASLGDATGPRVIEAERLAEAIPLPTEISPELAYTYSYDKVRIFTGPDSFAVARILNLKPEEFTAAAPGFVTGFRTSARSDKHRRLSYEIENLVMLFDDEQAAKNAAVGLGKEIPGSDASKYSTTSLAKYPEATAFWSPEYATFHSAAATGRFVIYTYLSDHLSNELSTSDLPTMTQKAERSIEVISSGLTKFTPTPRDQWDQLPRDVDGILSMTVPSPNESQTYAIEPAVYGRHAALHISEKTDEDKKLFEELGVDLVSYNGGLLYRTRDNEAAVKLVENRSTLGKLYKFASPPPGLPAAKCYEYKGTASAVIRFQCSIASGRFAATISANQLADAHQRISAQYLLLAQGK
ncbi:DUF7373 family lipoprotein [Nocardia sp. SSK8]|uniref:DUF7373 family lipoprotein n=1 Tax=Nocardia sp. SSK8 TaxID=3120154 RepID=UPI00300AB756